MNFFESLKSPVTTLWWAFLLSIIIIYPNIGELLWALFAPSHKCTVDINTLSIIYFIYRYLFFVTLTWLLIRLNIKQSAKKLNEKFWKSFLITLGAYLIYVIIGKSIDYHIRLDCFTQTVVLQFLIAWLPPILIGHIYYLTVVQRENEKEMEKLRTENLQSQVDALVNQINPHFFFNSLNGLTALVAANRNEETIEYVSKLSCIFRYILQSEKKGLVKLKDELEFLDAYRYLIEVRYHGKISFIINIKQKDYDLQLPVLSLLPLIENIVKHNIIDSEHKMTVDISISENKELVVTNHIYHKHNVEESHGIGLTNLSTRYKLLMGETIKVIKNKDTFKVILPLKNS
ncbi:MAG: histidine kinase [Bacteroidales bacterium]|jgi:hypothetical protein|nr:histidine kinase [Bacteroidales bacterium]